MDQSTSHPGALTKTCVSCARACRFFYKYNPLPNVIVENNPLRIILAKIAWREMEKLTRGTSRHLTWRITLPAIETGGLNFQPLPLAECGGPLLVGPASQFSPLPVVGVVYVFDRVCMMPFIYLSSSTATCVPLVVSLLSKDNQDLF
jgi:hypothetical protein